MAAGQFESVFRQLLCEITYPDAGLDRNRVAIDVDIQDSIESGQIDNRAY